MGKLIYGTMATSVELDDRVLAHLRMAIVTKLRRGEPFMFELEMGEGIGRRTLWMHPSVPVQFQFYGSREPAINLAWVEGLVQVAGSLGGLVILPEPARRTNADGPAERAVDPDQPSSGLGDGS